MGVLATRIFIITSALQIYIISEVNGFTIPLQSANTKYAPIIAKRQTDNKEYVNVQENYVDKNCNVAKEIPLAVAIEPNLFIASYLNPVVNIQGIPSNTIGFINKEFPSQISDSTEFRVDLLPTAISLESTKKCGNEESLHYLSLPPDVTGALILNQPSLPSFSESLTPVQLNGPKIVVPDFPPISADACNPFNNLDMNSPSSFGRPQTAAISCYAESYFPKPVYCDPETFFTPLIPTIFSYSELHPVTSVPYDSPFIDQSPNFEQPCDYISNPFNSNQPITFIPFDATSSNYLRYTIEPDIPSFVPCNDLSSSQFFIPLESFSQYENFNTPLKRDTTLCTELPLTTAFSTPPDLPLPLPMSTLVNNIDASNLINYETISNNLLAPSIEYNPYLAWSISPQDYENNFIPAPSYLCTPFVYPSSNPSLDTIQLASLDTIQSPYLLPSLINDFDYLQTFTSPGVTMPLSSSCPLTSSANSICDTPIVATDFTTNPIFASQLNLEPHCFIYPSNKQNSDTSMLDNLQNTFALPEILVTPSVSNVPSLGFTNTPYSSPIFPSIILSSPMAKYFEEERRVTAKLNEFIASFNSRLSLTSTLRSPRTLYEPNLDSFAVSSFKIPSTPTLISSYGCDSGCISLTSYDDEFSAPKVPLAYQNYFFNYPADSSSVPYNSFQESISALSYSNLLPIPYCQNIAYPSYTSDLTSNLDKTDTSSLLADIMSSISVKGIGTTGPFYPIEPIPYLSSVSLRLPISDSW